VSKLIERESSGDTIYPVDIPGHVWPRRTGRKDPAVLYFSYEQLAKLRANIAKTILKANKHRMENR
jgi:hypothetical protein